MTESQHDKLRNHRQSSNVFFTNY